jgi:heme-degrading monooxygenase HmoA
MVAIQPSPSYVPALDDGRYEMPETYTSGVWVAKEGHEGEFVEAWTDFVEWASEFPGSGTFRLVRDVDDASRFMSFAPWESFEAQRDWKQSDEWRERMGRVQQHVAEFTPAVFELVTEVR